MEYLQPLLDDGIDTLVLGCTHYPLLRAAIARLLGDSVTLVDSAENCAHAVRDLLGIGQLRIVRCGNAIDHEQADSRRILHPDSLSIEHLLLAQGKTKLQDHGFL
jgi:glutamate racemase